MIANIVLSPNLAIELGLFADHGTLYAERIVVLILPVVIPRAGKSLTDFNKRKNT